MMEEEKATVEPITAVVNVAPKFDAKVQGLREEILKVRDYALQRQVKTIQEAEVATNDLSIISALKKELEGKRREYLKPLQDYTKQINDVFKLISDPLLEADKVTRDQILAFKAEQERLRNLALEAECKAREAAAAAQRVLEETGEIIETPPVPDAPPDVTKTVHADLGTSGMVMIKKWEVTDFSLVPDKYKAIDFGLVGKVIRAGGDIPGIRVWEEPTLRVTTKKESE